MFLKIHRAPGSSEIVAVCDRELLNTTHCHGTMKVTISEAFYGNTPATEAEVLTALKNAGIINLMGERAVSTAVGMGLVARSDCIMIGSVPHVQIYRL
jgi:uncharacterized protein